MRRRVKKKVWISFIIILAIFISVISLIKYNQHIHSTSYLLGKKGYTKEEINLIEKQKDVEIKNILDREYDKNMVPFLKENYFIAENMDRYLAFKNKFEEKSIEETVRLVNVNRDKDFYTDIEKTDTEKENLILVNKYHALDKDFSFDDIGDVSILHCYGTQKLRKEAYDKFKEMFNAAKKENLTIIINSSYRSFDYQESLWKRYADNNGEEWADSYAARQGHSEHQTGLAIDVTTYGMSSQDNFESTDEFKWLQENAYKYGFILRYPKGKEDITGYAYESWHYRYVGTAVAKEIHDLDITFDEYYAYYLK